MSEVKNMSEVKIQKKHFFKDLKKTIFFYLSL